MYQTAIGAQHMRTTEDRVPELPGPYFAVPPFYVKAFPEYLRAAGYYTANRAKTDYQFGVPFTIWDDLEGKLSGSAALWMRTSRPAEELFDPNTDRHQIRSLAEEPAHRATLERMRRAVTDWMTRIGDQGLINEAEMIQRMWPGGVQPETAQPYVVPRRSSDAPERHDTIAIQSPMVVIYIYVPTQGASIGYATEDGPNAKWMLYTGPIRADRPMALRAKAIRYGYKESQETRVVFTKPQ
jgi:N-sulfoglucosamine sulfohydrolase